jgi:hypothetical protein
LYFSKFACRRVYLANNDKTNNYVKIRNNQRALLHNEAQAQASNDNRKTRDLKRHDKTVSDCVSDFALSVLNALLTGDGLFGTFAGASVGLRTLSTHGKTLTVADSAITSDFAKTGNILINLTAELTFDDVVVVEQRGQTRDFFLFKVLGANRRINTGLTAKFAGGLGADAIEIRQRNRGGTIIRNINA